LPAKAVCQALQMLNVLAHSQASQLPQGCVIHLTLPSWHTEHRFNSWVVVANSRASAPWGYPVKKIAVFADVQNLYYTVRQAHGCHFNYAALWADISQRGQIVEAYAYAIDRGDSKQQQFQQILRNLGFTVKLKPYIQRSDGSAKGDWDVGITIDIMDIAAHVDEVVLASGDGDFDLLLERIISKHGVEAVAYGVPGLTANSLIRAASRYVPIEGALLLKN
jgi:uncharacterized LabA/DUF88 family protein